jgi:hypothetical protein
VFKQKDVCRLLGLHSFWIVYEWAGKGVWVLPCFLLRPKLLFLGASGVGHWVIYPIALCRPIHFVLYCSTFARLFFCVCDSVVCGLVWRCWCAFAKLLYSARPQP